MEVEIKVGIPVAGTPRLSRSEDCTLLHNMLIGKGFHWQREIEAILPGRIELHPDSEFPVVNTLPLESYLRCVVGSEMNPDAPAEFLKAHSVISRSWALGKITGSHDHSEEGKVDTPETLVSWEDTCDHHGFHVCSDDHCQRYQGLQPLSPEIAEALESTRGEVLRSPSGKLVDARFSKCCGGHTELFSSCWQPRREECLDSFPDPWCDLSAMPEQERHSLLASILKDYDLENQGGYQWHAAVTPEEVRGNLLTKFGRDIGDIREIEILERGASGRAVRIRLTGSEGTVDIGKELMIRRLLAPTHLYSSWIDIIPEMKPTGDGRSEVAHWHISGHGWGHGVGLCQIGAARMAIEGHSYRDILAFYYPGALIDRI